MALGARKKAVRGSRRTSASELLLLLPFLRILFIVFLFFLLPLFVLHLLYYRTSVCEPHGVQREHGAAMATNGNLVTGAADAHDGTGRAEEGGQHLFLAVSTAIRTHAGVVEEYEVVFLGHDVTPDPRLSSDPSISKGHLIAGHLVFARTGSQIPQKCLSVATN
jgi:hypothetical protein